VKKALPGRYQGTISEASGIALRMGSFFAVDSSSSDARYCWKNMARNLGVRNCSLYNGVIGGQAVPAGEEIFLPRPLYSIGQLLVQRGSTAEVKLQRLELRDKCKSWNAAQIPRKLFR
jgi:hypothetical protein